MSSSFPSIRPVSFLAIEKSRRDFLGWLAAGTALSAVGCRAASADDPLERRTYTAEGEEATEVAESAQTACRPTTRDARGPYWEPGAPVRPLQIAQPDEPGVRLLVEGTMLGPDCRTPLEDYAIDVWQADAEGNYHGAGKTDYRLRGKVTTDAQGRYEFETILPGRYGDAAGIRPAHLHVTFLTPGGNVLLTSQLYFEGDPFLGKQDYCTRQGTCNSADANRHLVLRDALIGKTPGKRAKFDPVMART
jgi:protocatechuate 3,4-dioxygenase beta subunit